MRRFFAALALIGLLCGFVLPTPTDSGNAQRAYSSFVGRFWLGDFGSGHFGIINNNVQTQTSTGIAMETPFQSGWLWQYAQAWNVPYVYWETAPAGDPLKADAQARLVSKWAWVKANWPNFSICGNVGSTPAQAMDDATWVSSGLIQLYDATSDATALQDAANLLTCAYARWYTTQTGGGLAYCDASDTTGCPSPEPLTKASYNGQFALAMLECAARGCSSGSISNLQMIADAKGIADWANAVEIRTSAVCPQSDSLYWTGVWLNGSTIVTAENECANPNNIAPASSVTQLSNNLSYAALNAKLSATYGSAYSTLATQTAASILAKEVDPNGVLINDRDARTALYGLLPFDTYVYPLLSPSQQAAWRSTMLATARSIVRQGAQPDGTYRPDWDVVWNTGWAASTCSDQLEVGAQQPVAVISARTYGY
jgi:hypothetical protein